MSCYRSCQNESSYPSPQQAYRSDPPRPILPFYSFSNFPYAPIHRCTIRFGVRQINRVSVKDGYSPAIPYGHHNRTHVHSSQPDYHRPNCHWPGIADFNSRYTQKFEPALFVVSECKRRYIQQVVEVPPTIFILLLYTSDGK